MGSSHKGLGVLWFLASNPRAKSHNPCRTLRLEVRPKTRQERGRATVCTHQVWVGCGVAGNHLTVLFGNPKCSTPYIRMIKQWGSDFSYLVADEMPYIRSEGNRRPQLPGISFSCKRPYPCISWIDARAARHTMSTLGPPIIGSNTHWR